MTRALVENRTRYAPSSGIEPLRAALANKLTRKNHIPAGIDDVLVTAGGAHAIYVAFQAVLDPGDDVLLFSPFWTPIREMINGAQARPLLVATAGARRHGLTATLEKMTTSHTRAIYYNTPQNPAGTVFTRPEAEEVAAFAKKHDLIVISDEAYEDLVYEGEHFSIASLPGMAERTISTFTFSKSYGMTGWRVGYLTAKEPFHDRASQAGTVFGKWRLDSLAMGGARSLVVTRRSLRRAAAPIPRAPRSARCRAQRSWPGV